MNIVEQVTEMRAIARQEKDTATYSILTQILGDYQTGATQKKPRTGDAAIIDIIRGIIKSNEISLTEMRARNSDHSYDERIFETETQSELLNNFLPDVLTLEEVKEILDGMEYIDLNTFKAFMNTNYPNRFAPGDVFKAHKERT